MPQDRYEIILGHAGFGVRDNMTGEWIADGLDDPEDAKQEVREAIERDAQLEKSADYNALLEQATRERGLPLSPWECGPEEEQLLALMRTRAEQALETVEGEYSQEQLARRVADAYAVLYGLAASTVDR